MSQASRALAHAFETGALAERRAFFLRAEDPPFAAIDFVGAEASAQFGWRALGRGGRLIVVGLFGGTFSTPMPMFAFTGNTIMGSVTGTPAEMKEMMGLVTTGKAEPVPVIKRKLDEADAALQDLRKGLVMGRAVLVP